MADKTQTIAMETVKIPGTSLVSSRIGLGTWTMGGRMWGGTDETDSIRTIHEALDCGISLIDTAPVYGFGRSEEIVGKALIGGRSASRRSDCDQGRARLERWTTLPEWQQSADRQGG
jgi:diketogulonate reductase-like aldo/keto reductase